jgi:hypothetical protein
MFHFRLTKLILRDETAVEPAPITLVAGPNNAGKSRLLKEIVAHVTTLKLDFLLLKVVECSVPAKLEELRSSYDVEPHLAGNRMDGWSVLGPDLCSYHRFSGLMGPSWPKDYEPICSATPDHWHRSHLYRHFGPQLIAYLTTEHRLQLVKENNSQGDEHKRDSLLLELYYSDKSGQRVQVLRSTIKDAFGLDIAFDFSRLGRVLFRIGSNFTNLPEDPRKALPILSECEKLDEQGDGLRAYVGIVAALLALRRDVFVIDEPETFLHPPQSIRIGRFLGDQANLGRQLIVATHSADVLRGILTSGAQIRILRIDRIGNTNTFRILDTERIKEIATDPLLSSARVLDGLFFSGAVVVEADADARFYQTASTKCRQDLDLHFVNADNKQTVPRIMSIYREMGVRCAGIVDFDVLNNADEFLKQIDALQLQEPQKTRAISLRDQIAKAAKESPPADRLEGVEKQLNELLAEASALLKKSFANPDEKKQQQENLLRKLERRFHELAVTTKAWREFKQRGRAALTPAAQSVFDELSNICTSRGLFINPYGELESTLEEHGIDFTTDKRKWITTALRLLPSLIVEDTKKPWAFMKNLHDYITEPLPTTGDAVRSAP